ncbi:hypothetical protein K458DRAFT_396280 [Lentithecium fluviatile CBS 122367]|uniref:Uncharacterized protein n=1 Tax=Lentithecium fluviatile CBS 122367 TaxID=1168545 RepID=A0A6G1IFL6_9PLEO|nr:hypothetical protein K458DRAFT_396280 [Lentithecium fluviatile CBS 122367]
MDMALPQTSTVFRQTWENLMRCKDYIVKLTATELRSSFGGFKTLKEWFQQELRWRVSFRAFPNRLRIVLQFNPNAPASLGDLQIEVCELIHAMFGVPNKLSYRPANQQSDVEVCILVYDMSSEEPEKVVAFKCYSLKRLRSYFCLILTWAAIQNPNFSKADYDEDPQVFMKGRAIAIHSSSSTFNMEVLMVRHSFIEYLNDYCGKYGTMLTARAYLNALSNWNQRYLDYCRTQFSKYFLAPSNESGHSE